MSLADGIAPETCFMFEKAWLVCGYCNELLAEMDGRTEIPDRCPFCGAKVKKGGKADS